MKDVWEKEYELIYLFHSRDCDFYEVWGNIHHDNSPFWEGIREKLRGKRLVGLAVIKDNPNKPHPYAFFGVVEKEEEKEEER